MNNKNRKFWQIAGLVIIAVIVAAVILMVGQFQHKPKAILAAEQSVQMQAGL